jgi:diguanylate cyclase (GGDEF)-like protein
MIQLVLMTLAVAGTSPPATSGTETEIERMERLNRQAKEVFTSDPELALRYAEEARRLAVRHDQPRIHLETLANLGGLHQQLGQIDKAMEYYLHGEMLAARLITGSPEDEAREHAKKLRSRLLMQLGGIYQARQEYEKALDCYGAALELERSGERKQTLLTIHLQTGVINLIIGDYDPALEHCLDAMRLAETLEDSAQMAHCAYFIGYINRNLRKLETALEYFQLSARLSRETSQLNRLANALNEIGNIFTLQGEPEAGLAIKQEALSVIEQTDDRYTLAACLHDIGMIHASQENYSVALPYFQRAYAIDVEIGLHREIITCLLNIALCYSQTGRPAEARREAEKCVELARANNLNFELMNALETLAMSAYDLGEYKLAADRFYDAFVLKDEIYDHRSQAQMAEMQARFDSERMERQIALLRNTLTIQELETQKENQAKRLLLAGIGALLLTMLLIFRQYRHKTASNRIIQFKNKELQAAYEQLDRTARLDPLTELANRRDMLERLDTERRRSKRSGHPFTLVLADIDNFKLINDRYGHDCGDAVLVSMARRLRADIRKQDTAARWGGEEFLLLLPDTDARGGTVLAEKVRAAVAAEAIHIEDRTLTLSMTFGVAEYRPDESLDDCLKRADDALYQGKRTGKNRVVTATAAAVPPA